MAVGAAYLLFLLAIAGSLSFPMAAEIKSESLREDARPSILFEKFGFSKTGVVRIIISGAAISSTFAWADPKQIGFFLLSDESLFQAIYESQERPPSEKRAEATGGTNEPDFSGCVLSSPYVKTLVTHPNEYSLYFANCTPESLATMKVRTEMYNANKGAIHKIQRIIGSILSA